MAKAAAGLYGLCKQLYASHPIEFSLTPEQRSRLGQHLEHAYPALVSQLGSNFHSIVLRMAVQIERIALILTALRVSCAREFCERELLCSDQDYATAELIGNKLILHMAAAYRMIRGKEEVAVPKIEALDQRKMLLSLLPAEFGHKELVQEAKSQGIPSRTAERWNDSWLQQGLIGKLKHGLYKKIA